MAPSDEQRRSQKSIIRSLDKRSKGLCKKATELSTLCNADVCLVCYRPGATAPVVWPEDPTRVGRTIGRYLAASPSKKLAKNQVSFKNPNPGQAQEAVTNNDDDDDEEEEEEEECKEAKARNGKKKVVDTEDRLRLPWPDDDCALGSLVEALDSRLKKVRDRIEQLVAEDIASTSTAPAPPDKYSTATGGASTSCSAYREPPAPAFAAVCPCMYCPLHGYWAIRRLHGQDRNRREDRS
ncbi:agamous-like MADS-box protein AGL80 [Musa acuminata AAA Group]|uniref:agamous-like MADS-box protein AGL80 n=1 Tax=Musa acuminata AAA Group TaxID=214697 RepID=UPI0031E29A9A